MALMVYLIIVTATTVPKIWDPYDILGISRVGFSCYSKLCILMILVIE